MFLSDFFPHKWSIKNHGACLNQGCGEKKLVNNSNNKTQMICSAFRSPWCKTCANTEKPDSENAIYRAGLSLRAVKWAVRYSWLTAHLSGVALSRYLTSLFTSPRKNNIPSETLTDESDGIFKRCILASASPPPLLGIPWVMWRDDTSSDFPPDAVVSRKGEFCFRFGNGFYGG